MSKELEKNYNPSEIEDRLYHKWLEKKYFHAEVNRDKKPFTIVMPPPNITGKLHMGHALDNTMQLQSYLPYHYYLNHLPASERFSLSDKDMYFSFSMPLNIKFFSILISDRKKSKHFIQELQSA